MKVKNRDERECLQVRELAWPLEEVWRRSGPQVLPRVEVHQGARGRGARPKGHLDRRELVHHPALQHAQQPDAGSARGERLDHARARERQRDLREAVLL